MNWKLWLHGLIAAAIGGAVTALFQMLSKPQAVNFSAAGWHRYGAGAAGGALVAVLGYFKASPAQQMQISAGITPPAHPEK